MEALVIVGVIAFVAVLTWAIAFRRGGSKNEVRRPSEVKEVKQSVSDEEEEEKNFDAEQMSLAKRIAGELMDAGFASEGKLLASYLEELESNEDCISPDHLFQIIELVTKSKKLVSN